MWYFEEDKTPSLITAKEHIQSAHGGQILSLPKTVVIFCMSGTECIKEKYDVQLLSNRFPRFLNACPIYQITNKKSICFLDGGRGAPQIADTLETLKALGTEDVILVGMCGAFSDIVSAGDIIITPKAYSEEGTSLHYYETIDYSTPDKALYNRAVQYFPLYKTLPIVSTDSAYRETYFKEKIWREKGCVAVDMETSALFSVGRYLGLRVVSILMVSDKHPETEQSQTWNWTMTRQNRNDLILHCIDFVCSLP